MVYPTKENLGQFPVETLGWNLYFVSKTEMRPILKNLKQVHGPVTGHHFFLSGKWVNVSHIYCPNDNTNKTDRR